MANNNNSHSFPHRSLRGPKGLIFGVIIGITGDVKDLPKSGHPKITQDKKIDIVLSMEENPQRTSTLVASENEVSQTTVLRILRKENYHPYTFQLVQELNEDDPDRRLQFYVHFGMRKVCTKLVPKVLTDDQKARRVETCQELLDTCEDNPALLDDVITGDEKPRLDALVLRALILGLQPLETGAVLTQLELLVEGGVDLLLGGHVECFVLPALAPRRGRHCDAVGGAVWYSGGFILTL
ncbi:hypothetical protein NQ318_013051 [Aromia moschata]|uniref:Uncharacterized protein n=1 Tax=Aromia moschata TaxID=1265417 RepID=A0AAV8XMW2_9CUCU|nr:hypothetical protein NQ318_013051 [Aromia moschata]